MGEVRRQGGESGTTARLRRARHEKIRTVVVEVDAMSRELVATHSDDSGRGAAVAIGGKHARVGEGDGGRKRVYAERPSVARFTEAGSHSPREAGNRLRLCNRRRIG